MTAKTVNYAAEADAAWDAGNDNVVDEYTAKFEAQFELAKGDNIGGLIVYAADNKVRAVYDYENFCGWVV